MCPDLRCCLAFFTMRRDASPVNGAVGKGQHTLTPPRRSPPTSHVAPVKNAHIEDVQILVLDVLQKGSSMQPDSAVDIPDLKTLLRLGRWTNPPADVTYRGDELLVTAVRDSDAWRHTASGFVHDSEHGLLAPMAASSAVEVSFVLD